MPFVLKDYRPAEIVDLDANPELFPGRAGHRGRDHPPRGGVRDPAAAAAASGDVDIAKNLTPDQIAGLAGKDTIKVETYPQAAVHFLSFNQKIEALQPEAVWEAARYLVDYKGMTDSFLKGQMQIHQAFWPWASRARSTTPVHLRPGEGQADPRRRRREDADQRHPRRDQLAPFTDMAQSLQASFAEAGINFEIMPGTGSAGDHQVPRAHATRRCCSTGARTSWTPHSNAGPSPTTRTTPTTPTADHHLAERWAVPAEMNADDQGRPVRARSRQAAMTMYVDLQKKVQAKSPIIIMFQAAYQVAIAKNVDGYVNGATSDFVFYRLVKKS